MYHCRWKDAPAAAFSCPEKSRGGQEADGAGRKDFAKWRGAKRWGEKCGQKVIFFQKRKIKLDYLTRILYNPVFDSWIKERNAEVIGITSFQRFAS